MDQKAESPEPAYSHALSQNKPYRQVGSKSVSSQDTKKSGRQTDRKSGKVEGVQKFERRTRRGRRGAIAISSLKEKLLVLSGRYFER